MPSIYQLKPAFQRLLRPLVRRLAAAGVTANAVTIAAVVLSGAAGLLILLYPAAAWPLLLVPLVLFLRMALNAIDGMLAREHGLASPLGALLNELGDVLADAALYLPFALVPGMPAALLVSVVLLGIVNEMAGVVAVQIGASRRYDGPLGKSDRAFAFGLIALLAASGLPVGGWLTLLLAVLLLLSLLTLVNRSRRALAEVAGSSRSPHP